MSALSAVEAKELGNALRFIRTARRMPLREVSAAAQVSYQYIHDIEEGRKTGVSDEVMQRLQRAYRLPERPLDDLLLRARVRSDLVLHGISRTDADAGWRLLEHRLVELGTPINTDLSAILAAILGQV